MSKYIIYDNYDIDKYYEEAKENLACNDFPKSFRNSYLE